MIKVYCDICGKEINQTVFIGNNKYENTEVIIHHEGRTSDICKVCQNELARYALEDMRNRAKSKRQCTMSFNPYDRYIESRD